MDLPLHTVAAAAPAPHIARSWRRCAGLGLGLPDPLSNTLLRERRDQALELLRCAQPELDSLAEHALEQGCVVVLSDASGLILDEIGSPDFLPKAQQVALLPGVSWAEAQCGTNAIGTALVEQAAVMVLGAEHSLPQNAALGCAAAPIFTGRGEIAGVLDMSGETVRVNSHALGLVRMAAQQIEHRMLLARARGRLLRFHPRPGVLGTAREGLLLVEDEQVVGANLAALGLLGLDWGQALDQPVSRLIGAHWPRLAAQRGLLTLADGRQVPAQVDVAPGARRSVPAGGARGLETVDVATAVAAPAPARPGADTPALPAADSDAVAPLLDEARRVLDHGVPVLVAGETGAGKDVFARALHAASRRAAGPFVAVNCAALPETLIEAELFGYEEGAYTGARRKGAPGRLREAHGGVLFLDEIGDMPLALQTRLLRVLEERSVTPLGGGRPQPVDFDLVCASHRDLAAMVEAGAFRRDLYYRVQGHAVSLPALRERADRRALIVRLFEQAGAAERGLRLDAAALAALDRHPWPGNVRELLSVLRTLVALAPAGERIGVERLPVAVRGRSPGGAPLTPDFTPDAAPQPAPSAGFAAGAAPHAPHASSPPHAPFALPARPGEAAAGSLQELADLERAAITRALADCGGRVAEAARRLGVHRSTVYRHLAQQRAAA